jgi:uncharacterized protein (TIGR00369 family)
VPDSAAMADPETSPSPTASSETSEADVVMDAEALDRFMADAFGRPMNWTIERVDKDGLRVRQPVDQGDSRPGGTVSGPTLMSLADGVAYMAVLSRIGPEALAVTSNLNINFLRRPRLVDLVVEGSLLKLGRTLAVGEVSLYSDGGDPDDMQRPVAHATVTYSLALLDGGSDAKDEDEDRGTA